MANQAYGWRNARSRRSQSQNYTDQMAADGREQSTSGQYKTRPGAPMAGEDDTPTGLPGVSGGHTSKHVWDAYFSKTPTPAMGSVSSLDMSGPDGVTFAPSNPASAADIAPAPNDSYWNKPHPSRPSSYVDATVASQDRYFNALGQPIARPRAGMTQAGTSFSSQYGEGGVTSAIPPLPSVDSLTASDPVMDFLNLGSSFDTPL